jgi:hypothetical protein
MESTSTEKLFSVPSSDRVEVGSFPLPAANFPITTPLTPINTDDVATQWVKSFNKTISCSDYASLPNLFLTESYWRDQLCLTWDFHTLQGPQQIVSQLKSSKEGCRIKAITLDKSTSFRSPTATTIDAKCEAHIVQAFLTVDTDVGRGAGLVRLVQDQGVWKVFTLFTFLQELKGHEELLGKKRPYGVQHGEYISRKNWQDRRRAEENYEDGEEPTVLILGKSLAVLDRPTGHC